MAVSPLVVREMTLREIAAYLLPLTSADPPPAGLMAHHPRNLGAGSGRT